MLIGKSLGEFKKERIQFIRGNEYFAEKKKEVEDIESSKKSKNESIK